MKNSINHSTVSYFIVLLSCILIPTITNAQTAGDSAYLPPIKIIADPSSYGPYFINTKHTNVYFVTDFPESTSKVIMKYNDSKGLQLGESKIEEGSDISVVEWSVESEDVGFALSPNLNIEVHYKTDSVAIYNIPYIVYPDTVKFFAKAGWGPFISNNYPLSDGWQPVPAVSNSFTVKNLPPRTDTLQFQVLSTDSTVIRSYWVIAPEGQYLDSAVFANVRMDSLPLSTQYLRTLIWCEGGPETGLSFHKELPIITQEPKLISIVDGISLQDSIGVFIEHDFIGQALLIDSVKYAEISNGPGSWDLDDNLQTIYRGPYCFDLFENDYSIEAWLKFDIEKVGDAVHDGLSMMSVDSVWEFRFDTYGEITWFSIRSLAVEDNNYIFTAKVPFEDLATSEWHHVAITSYYSGSGNAHINFYFDGKKWGNTVFYEQNFEYIKDNINTYGFMGTQPLYLGVNPALYPVPMISYITAMDEVRLWDGVLSAGEIKNNFHKKVLQEDWLVGYWNFDDLRNRLGYISDLSYKNNRGILKKGATFIPQHPTIQTTPDSILFYSSNSTADSVIYNFIDHNKQIVAGDTNQMHNGGDTLLFDVSSLPDNIAKLNIREFSPGGSDSGSLHTYILEGWAPTPIATPRYNWNSFYSAFDFGVLNNSIVVSGFPNRTTKVELGLQKGDDIFDLDTLTENSIPYRYSLSLNGTDNYVETAQNVNSTVKLTMSLWFKTTTTEGGKIIGFTDTQNGITSGKHDREIIMEKDGSLRFYVVAEDSTYILSAVNKYNDGVWHYVKVRFKEHVDMDIYVDGCLVDHSGIGYIDPYSGYWIIGRNHEAKIIRDPESVSEYFKGSICEVVITDTHENSAAAMATVYSSPEPKSATHYYKFDDGKGTEIQDYAGSNTGELKGSSTNWFVANTISFVVWDHNILNKDPGTYDFFARVFYRGGPPEGAKYLLGRNHLKNPFPEHNFTYNMRNGFGYFNEGTALTNYLDFWINNTDSDSADWKENFLQYKLFTPDHYLIDHDIYTYTETYNEYFFEIDMGDAPPGSYLSLEVGYHTTDNTEYVTNQIAFPLYFNPMLAPIVSGSFGPFDQAIAPETMAQPNTFIITTEILSDLNKVVANFYDKSDNKLGETDAVQINDTTWHITYDMGPLSPPTSKLKIEYYLGVDPRPALVQGPFAITIHKTRPKWFDFIADTSFHDAQETGDEVTFSLITPFEKNWLANNVMGFTINSWVPLLGGSKAKLKSPNVRAMLKWDIPTHKLELNEAPKFYQESLFLSFGFFDILGFNFNTTQDNSYSIDSQNDLIATQNFKMGGTLSRGALEIPFLVKKLNRLINLAASTDPESVIVKPSFQIVGKGSFEYAARLHLMTDTVSGGWGSVGNLDIDANPHHGDAYKNSASYHFYSGAIGIEFDIGLTFFEGLASVHFGIDGRAVIGYGHSYISIPNNQTQKLKSAVFQIYGRAYVTALWGWYSHNFWGPRLFYSDNFWGSDMSNCFPPLQKSELSPTSIPANSSWPELTRALKPVRKFSKIPMPVPEPNISSSQNNNLFSWVERGKTYGERKLETRYLDYQKRTFSDKLSIEINNNALNSHISDATTNKLSFFTWAQTRHDNWSIMKVKRQDVLSEFVKAQDIWYAIYDQEEDSIILKAPIEDDNKNLTSGRAEANPVVAAISDSRVLISWQVADLDNFKSELWYLLLEKSGDNWSADSPEVLTKIDGIATNMEIASTGDEQAVITWLNTNRSDTVHNTIMTVMFDGSDWSTPEILLDENDNYYNYLTLNIKNGLGGLVFTTFIEDSSLNICEKVLFIPWETVSSGWLPGEPLVLMIDSVNHLQLPGMAIREDGTATIAIKVEELVIKNDFERISQVDLLLGNLNDPYAAWKHIEANEFICDTTKQLADMQITYVGEDTLMILSNEYPMLPTNTSFEPVNGIIFGDPYMNLVLRSFAVDEDGKVHDVDENDFFTGINEIPESKSNIRLYQNYPNPCSESTTITFDIPGNSRVKLELFDIKGNKVATLMEQQLSAGRYEVKLNTSLLNRGTYIYRLTSDGSTTALRMMVGN